MTKKSQSKKSRSKISKAIATPGVKALASARKISAKQIAIPAAAIAGAGALAAAGFVLREEIVALVDVALGSLAPSRLLGYVGLSRKRSMLASVLPELAGFAVGLASGAGLMLLRPRTEPAAKPAMAPGLADVASMTNSGISAGPYAHPVP